MKNMIALAAFALTAQTLSASVGPDFVFNGIKVNQVNSAIFETSPGRSSRSDNMWCAASEYARRKLGASWQQELYVVRGYAPSQTTGSPTSVQFTLDPKAAGLTADNPGFGSGFQAGANVSVQQASIRCNRIPFRDN